MDYNNILEHIYNEILPYAKEGQQATYIPALAEVNPDQFGICIETTAGKRYQLGQAETRFSIQSISKVFSLAMAFAIEGENLWTRMGKEPSGSAFNSLVQLEYECGKPRNPFINAGAIVTADILLKRLPDAESNFIEFVRSMAGNDTINYNHHVAASEKSCGYMNAAIANLIKHHNNLNGDVTRVLDFYFMMCSIEMNCVDLAHAFTAFANHHQPFNFGGVSLTQSQIKRINAVMQTCGFYDEAGEFSYLVGLPGKSGVGGGIAAINPDHYAVSVWSPRLNGKGNSVMGMKALELLTTFSHESIF